jgi:protein TonB
MTRSASPRAIPLRRLATALAVSAFVHLFVSSLMMSGAARRVLVRSVSSVPEPRTLAVRLVVPEAAIANAQAIAERQNPSGAPTVNAKAAATLVVSQPGANRDAAGSAPVDMADSTYYGARQLDVYPALVSVLDLPRPAERNPEGSEEYVLLLVMIDATGAVEDVSVVEAHASGIVNERAIAALRSARFSAAVRSGRAVKSRLFIRIDYGASAEAR